MINSDAYATSISTQATMTCNQHAKRYKMTSVLTFDQLLWFNANKIVDAEPLSSDISKVVVRLGRLVKVFTTGYAEIAVCRLLTEIALTAAILS